MRTEIDSACRAACIGCIGFEMENTGSFCADQAAGGKLAGPARKG